MIRPQEKTKALTPYQRIVRAAKKERGVLLSPAEVRQMARDEAIAACAENDDGPAGITTGTRL